MKIITKITVCDKYHGLCCLTRLKYEKSSIIISTKRCSILSEILNFHLRYAPLSSVRMIKALDPKEQTEEEPKKNSFCILIDNKHGAIGRNINE